MKLTAVISISCAPLLLLLHLSFFELSLPMHLLSPLGCYSTHPPKHFLIVPGWMGILTLPYPSVQIVPQLLYGGQKNLDCMVASPMRRCYCLPEKPEKLWLHMAGHCPAVNQLTLVHHRHCNEMEELITVSHCCLILPSATISCYFTPCAMPLQTIMEPP